MVLKVGSRTFVYAGGLFFLCLFVLFGILISDVTASTKYVVPLAVLFWCVMSRALRSKLIDATVFFTKDCCIGGQRYRFLSIRAHMVDLDTYIDLLPWL